jgi:hypothetical protein
VCFGKAVNAKQCRRFRGVFVSIYLKVSKFQILPEKIFWAKTYFLRPPPHHQKIFGQCTILGVKKFFRTYQNFSRHKKNFPDDNKFSPFIKKIFWEMAQFFSKIPKILEYPKICKNTSIFSKFIVIFVN